MNTKRTVGNAAIAGAAIHLIGVLLTWWYLSATADGEAPLVWVYWTIFDLPWSMVIADYMNVYYPLFVHGVIGTAWWYFLIMGIGKIVN